MSEKSIIDKLEVALKNEIAQRHSYFQLKYFLIGKEPTNQAKMWQCLREMKTRKESLEAISLEIEETKDVIELLDISIQKTTLELNGKCDDLSIREMNIKIKQIERKKQASEKNLLSIKEKSKFIEEECNFFLGTFNSLVEIEPLKNFDDLETQKEYWGEKLSRKLNMKLLTNSQLDVELIETIVALPDDTPIKQQALNTLSIRHDQMIEQLSQRIEKKQV